MVSETADFKKNILWAIGIFALRLLENEYLNTVPKKTKYYESTEIPEKSADAGPPISHKLFR
jgi:hypothetical protein